MKVYWILPMLLLVFARYSFCQDDHNGIELSETCSLATQPVDQTNIKSLSEAFEAGTCFGLVRGVMESMMMWRAADTKHAERAFYGCIPDEVTAFEAAKVVVKYLNDNPTKLHERDVIIIFFALHDAYPCKRGQ